MRRIVSVRSSGAIVTHDEVRSVGRALGHAPFGRTAVAMQVMLVPVRVRHERICDAFKFEAVVPYSVAEWHEREARGLPCMSDDVGGRRRISDTSATLPLAKKRRIAAPSVLIYRPSFSFSRVNMLTASVSFLCWAFRHAPRRCFDRRA